MSAARLLLDTHTFIWWATGDRRLSNSVVAALSDVSSEVILSVVTPWEIAIKHASGRLTLQRPVKQLVAEQVARHRYTTLPVRLEHVLEVAELPSHHGDPFDRLLVAQARVEGMMLVSRDTAMRAYDVPVLW